MFRSAEQPLKPIRPGLTGLFACGCSFWAACALAYASSQALSVSNCLQGALVMAALLVASTVTCIALKRMSLCAILAFALMGACLGLCAAATVHSKSEEAAQMGYVEAEATLVADSRESSTGECAFADVAFDDGRQALLYVDFRQEAPMLQGDCVKVAGFVVAADWEKDGYLWQNGATGRLRVKSSERIAAPSVLQPLKQVRSAAIEAIGAADDAHALMQALVCGYRRNLLGTSPYACFQSCGLAHLVAVSGAHLVIVTGMMATLLRSLRVPRRVSAFILIGLMGSYLVVSGMPVSAVRATIMSSVGVLSLLGKRRPSALNALGLGMIAIVGASPSASISASFTLSALSTAGIVLFAPLVESWIQRTRLAAVPFLADALSLTLSSAVLSQPYACSLFNVLPLVSPLANVMCAPLFPVACCAGLLASMVSIACPPAAPAALAIGSAPASLLLLVVGALSDVPYASIPVSIEVPAAFALSIVAAIALYVAWPSFRARVAVPALIVIIVLFCGLSYAQAQEDAIVMLDVGQGDAFLVRSRGSTLLIDTGNHDAQLLDQLARCGVTGLDAVLVTHSDDDHCGSLDALERGVDVKRALVASEMLESESEKNRELVEQLRSLSRVVVPLDYGSSFNVGAFTAHVIWPRAFSDEGGNADSVCLLLSYDGDGDGAVDFKALFTGDAEKDQLARMMEAGDLGAVDVLKVGHHGSSNALTKDEAETLGARVALIGVGEGNRYGHPASEVVDALERLGCTVYRSDRDGQVKCSFAPDSLLVSLQ